MVKIKAAAIVFFCIGAALAIPAMAINGTTSPKAAVSDNSNPYGVIVDRNIFRLNDPPPPPDPASQKKVELPKVSLNGIFKVGDDIRVLFSMLPKDAKVGVSYFKLAPGEKSSDEHDNSLELVKIHPDQKEVDIVINGTAMTLDMATNSGGSSAPSGPAPAPQVASASATGASAIVAGGSRNSSPYGAVTVAGGAGGGVTSIGGNNSTTSSSGGGVAVAGGNSSGALSGGSIGNGAGGALPNAQAINALLSGSGGPAQVANIPTGTVVPPDQQELVLAAQAALGEKNGTPLPPLPPSILEKINGTAP